MTHLLVACLRSELQLFKQVCSQGLLNKCFCVMVVYHAKAWVNTWLYRFSSDFISDSMQLQSFVPQKVEFSCSELAKPCSPRQFNTTLQFPLVNVGYELFTEQHLYCLSTVLLGV